MPKPNLGALVSMESLENKTFPFYGVCDNCFKLGGIAYEAVEDPDDGYRSMMEGIRVIDPTTKIFFRRSIAQVKVVAVVKMSRFGTQHDFAGYQLVDVSVSHVWLLFGTDGYDDYYPCFTFEYMPKEPKPEGHR